MLYYCNRINVRLVLNVLIICAFPLECILVEMARGVTLVCGRCHFGVSLGDVGVLGDELTSCGMGMFSAMS